MKTVAITQKGGLDMKRIAIALVGALTVTLFLGGMAEAQGPMRLSDGYLSGAEFTKNFGPGSIDSVQDLVREGVGFALSGLTSAGTGISDNFPLASASGCLGTIFPGIFSDCTGFNQLKVKFTNLGTAPVDVNVYMNTGFTAGGGTTPGCVSANAACDTFWQGPWTNVGPGKTQVVTLDFSNAEPFNCGDDPDFLSCVDGVNQPIFRLNEVTNLGFQVADFSGGPPTSTWLVVDPIP